MSTKRSEEVRIPVSFKKTPEELSIYNYVKESCGMAGQSAFVKQLVMEEMKRKGEWKFE
ncbi:hypothetical protein QOZ83_16945 [Romboutsia sedimentorum]|uniref:hypothetical protein n=1 Tax=Romboutsia sedimentorum TaxID=1368474 RepID=UPI0024DE863A|nr:hypothetical protein [Romboutsia sedimentorum]MDK2587528.1 hypothetical protein [Romboutsia sedimentorum]